MIAVAVIAFALGTMFSSPKKQEALPVPQTGIAVSPSAPKDTLPVYIVATKDASNPLYRISVEYPQFSNEPFTDGSLNKSISGAVNGKMNEFKSTSEENWKARQDTLPAGSAALEIPKPAPFYFTESWQAKQLNSHFASFILRFDSFEGGANEQQEIVAFNYDFMKKKIVSLGDLFPGVSDYLQQISRFARVQLSGSLNASGGGDFPADMLSEGTAPTPENFQNFIFDDDVVEFYFPKYQVAPGVYGEQHVATPRGIIR